VAHELMHNVGFDHWGCEHGGSKPECYSYPIPHGGTGAWGTDVVGWNIIPPGTPGGTHAHDLMNPIVGDWISWYDYDTLLNDPRFDSYDTPDPPGLLVSGHISAEGKVSFRPIYRVQFASLAGARVAEDDAERIYPLEELDGNGNVIYVHNFEP